MVGDTGDCVGFEVGFAVATGDAVGDTGDGVGFGVGEGVGGEVSHFFPPMHGPGPGSGSQPSHSGVVGLDVGSEEEGDA